jgi:hypothetical protein
VQYLIVSFSDNMFRYLVFNWYFWFIVGGACSLVDLQPWSKSPSASEARARRQQNGSSLPGAYKEKK